MKVVPIDILRSSKEISTFLQNEIRELQNSGKKVRKVIVGVQVQGAPVPPAWRKALEAFSNGTSLREFYVHIEGELGASRTGQEKRVGEKNLEKRKRYQFLSTLKRLTDRGILAVRPSSFLDEGGGLAWTDTDSKRPRKSGNSDTRKGWAKEMSTVWLEPNLRKLRREAGSQASWIEERALTLRKKGRRGRNITVEGLAAKQIRLVAE